MADDVHEPLIAENDQPICVQLAAGEPPHSQRATMLLALDAGATLEEAAAQSGFTLHQMKYWRGRYRSSGLAVFPEELVAKAASRATQAEENLVIVPIETEPTSKKKDKKSKSDKQAKAGKKKSGKDKKRSKKKSKTGKSDKQAKAGKKKSGKDKKRSKKKSKTGKSDKQAKAGKKKSDKDKKRSRKQGK